MRRGGRRQAGQAALLVLLLQLVLPLLTVHQATAAPGLGGPFVICTSAGLVWIDPGASTPEGNAPDGERDRAHNCPICFSKQLAAATLLPVAPLLHPLPRHSAAALPPAGAAYPAARTAPPLPARGPPLAA